MRRTSWCWRSELFFQRARCDVQQGSLGKSKLSVMESTVKEIRSGGQTGADRAAMDFAAARGVRLTGWVPQGRLDEAGTIPARYSGLEETGSPEVETRTRWNVHDSDATVILSHGQPVGGSRFTVDCAIELSKPHLHLDLNVLDDFRAGKKLSAWLSVVQPRSLNIAGPRASEDARIYERTMAVLEHAFCR